MSNYSQQDKLVDELFRTIDARPEKDASGIKKKVLILSTQRCGSTYFCNVLNNTGVFGYASEWFNELFFQSYARKRETSSTNLQDYLSYIYKKTTSENGVFSINVHIEQYIDMLEKYKFDILSMRFDHIYYLKRENKLKQALSFTKALVTNNWGDGMQNERDFPDDIPTSLIIGNLLRIARWDEYFRTKLQRYTQSEYVYEDFTDIHKTKAFDDALKDIGENPIKYEYKIGTNRMGRGDNSEILDNVKKYIGC